MQQHPERRYSNKSFPPLRGSWLPFAGQRPCEGLFCNILGVEVDRELKTQNLDGFLEWEGKRHQNRSLPSTAGPAAGDQEPPLPVSSSGAKFTSPPNQHAHCQGSRVGAGESTVISVSRDCWQLLEKIVHVDVPKGTGPSTEPCGTDASMAGTQKPAILTTTWRVLTLQVVPQEQQGVTLDAFCSEFFREGLRAHTLSKAPAVSRAPHDSVLDVIQGTYFKPPSQRKVDPFDYLCQTSLATKPPHIAVDTTQLVGVTHDTLPQEPFHNTLLTNAVARRLPRGTMPSKCNL
ncbi:hypothetical protein GWK47_036451 [Chionoecetes opilio]|uniref:Uncharacterized protein n=1 Tax=Chionoecetes opilio TaxID=41210 RepID=A0A8J5CZ06_CHIOP|nr:hypothetical protein GWK47_036451 [Chionoecetes opilio]